MNVRDILNDCAIPVPLVWRVADDASWLQIRNESLVGVEGGRKWRLSRFMTKSEVVQTAFKAYLAWVEHEAREHFTYKGAAIFCPHFDVDFLAGVWRKGKFEVRNG